MYFLRQVWQPFQQVPVFRFDDNAVLPPEPLEHADHQVQPGHTLPLMAEQLAQYAAHKIALHCLPHGFPAYDQPEPGFRRMVRPVMHRQVETGNTLPEIKNG